MSLKGTESRSDLEDLHLYATPREQRFRRFASLEFEGQLYMTPYDFIQAVTNDEPKRKRDFYTDKITWEMMVVYVIFPFSFGYYFCFWLWWNDAEPSRILFLMVSKCMQTASWFLLDCNHLYTFFFIPAENIR